MAKSRLAWFIILTTLMMAAFITTVVSMMQIETTTRDGVRRTDHPATRTGEADGGPKLWLLCQIFTTTLASVMAADLAVHPSATRGHGWLGTFLVMATTFVCAVLVLPVYIRVSAYWGEFLGLGCVFLVSMLFGMTAIRHDTQATAMRRQSAPDAVNLEER